jgi:hypothetical protein
MLARRANLFTYFCHEEMSAGTSILFVSIPPLPHRVIANLVSQAKQETGHLVPMNNSCVFIFCSVKINEYFTSLNFERLRL